MDLHIEVIGGDFVIHDAMGFFIPRFFHIFHADMGGAHSLVHTISAKRIWLERLYCKINVIKLR